MPNIPDTPKVVYWHRELPPVDAELIAEHTVEANSEPVAGTLAHRDELWEQCYQELMANAEHRLVQEVARRPPASAETAVRHRTTPSDFTD
jgi:hypothetical protein